MDKYMLISTTKYGQSTGSMHYNPYQQKSFRDKLKTNGELRSRASSVMSNRLQNQEIIIISPITTLQSLPHCNTPRLAHGVGQSDLY
jgi:hypothetical protein